MKTECKKLSRWEKHTDNKCFACVTTNWIIPLSLGIDRSWRRKAIAWYPSLPPTAHHGCCHRTGRLCHPRMPRTETDELDRERYFLKAWWTGSKGKEGRTFNKISLPGRTAPLSFADNRFDAITVAFGIRILKTWTNSLRNVPCTWNRRTSYYPGTD